MEFVSEATAQPPAAPPTNVRATQLLNTDELIAAELGAPDSWDRIIALAVREQASDVHLTYQADGVHLALRLDGRIAEQGVLPRDQGGRLTNHVKVLANLDLGESRRPQDGHARIDLDGRQVDLRVSILPTNHGQDTAVRILDRESALRTVAQLGVLPQQMDALNQLLDSPSGLLLVTGATGAGKTTTLYALLQHLGDGTRKVVTIEDPIEYDMPRINQAEVNSRIGLDYATILRSVLRQDPNVIMIGEIRDPETADIVVRAANAGRLVLATSHTMHVAAAVESLISLGANPHFVARAFRGAIAQTLVRRLCPYCTVRLDETTDVKLLADLEILGDVTRLLPPDAPPALSYGRGCPYCRHTGYRHRLGVFEILVADEETRTRISRGMTARELYEYVRNHGMLTIAQAGRLAVARGLTTIEELLLHVSEIWTGTP